MFDSKLRDWKDQEDGGFFYKQQDDPKLSVSAPLEYIYGYLRTFTVADIWRFATAFCGVSVVGCGIYALSMQAMTLAA